MPAEDVVRQVIEAFSAKPHANQQKLASAIVAALRDAGLLIEEATEDALRPEELNAQNDI